MSTLVLNFANISAPFFLEPYVTVEPKRVEANKTVARVVQPNVQEALRVLVDQRPTRPGRYRPPRGSHFFVTRNHTCRLTEHFPEGRLALTGPCVFFTPRRDLRNGLPWN